MAAFDKKTEPSQDSEVCLDTNIYKNNLIIFCAIANIKNHVAVLSPNGTKIPEASVMYKWYSR